MTEKQVVKKKSNNNKKANNQDGRSINIKKEMKKIHILIADDDERVREVIDDVLRTIGFSTIRQVKNGKQALEQLASKKYDILFCDWHMEPLTGIELVRTIRADASSINRLIPIIMITGKGEEENVKEARDSGVTEFLVKPFKVETLFKRIRHVIEFPRQFVIHEDFKGPDRRRRNGEHAGDERRED